MRANFDAACLLTGRRKANDRRARPRRGARVADIRRSRPGVGERGAVRRDDRTHRRGCARAERRVWRTHAGRPTASPRGRAQPGQTRRPSHRSGLRATEHCRVQYGRWTSTSTTPGRGLSCPSSRRTPGSGACPPQNAVPLAEAQGDWRGMAFAMQVLGLASEARGRPAEADRAYAVAVEIAPTASRLAPSDAGRGTSRPHPFVARHRKGQRSGRRVRGPGLFWRRRCASARRRRAATRTACARRIHSIPATSSSRGPLYLENGFGAKGVQTIDILSRRRRRHHRGVPLPTLAIDGPCRGGCCCWCGPHARRRICAAGALSAAHAGANEGDA